jgi:hypothetical protein
MDLRTIHCIGDSVVRKLEVDESLETWLELMRGYKGSMWANLFWHMWFKLNVYECL